jgi:hypothetical protein
MATVTVPRALAAALAALSLAVSGCLVNASYNVKVTTADDVEMEVPLTQKAEITAADEVMKVANFRFVPLAKDQERAMGYFFDLQFIGGNKPASVSVDDVSEAPILAVLRDDAPKLENGHWIGKTAPYSPADQHLEWITTLDNGVRVFRFTVKLTDGRTDVLRLPIVMPQGTKTIFRAQLGIK